MHHGVGRTLPSASSFVQSSDELVYVEDLRQEEVPDDDERDQTHGNDNTSEALTGPDHRSNDHRRDQADRKPQRRILHVAEHELTLVGRTSVRTAAARNRHADFTQRTQPRSHRRDPRTRFDIRTPKVQEGSDGVTAGESAYGEYERRQSL